jgi:high-affinity Fe2+/Pb2+ permease
MTCGGRGEHVLVVVVAIVAVAIAVVIFRFFVSLCVEKEEEGRKMKE